MIRIGYSLHKTSSGRVLIKLTIKEPPKIGSKVVNSSGKTIGRVVDIIGPINSPYVLIKLLDEKLTPNPYEEIFVKPRARRL